MITALRERMRSGVPARFAAACSDPDTDRVAALEAAWADWDVLSAWSYHPANGVCDVRDHPHGDDPLLAVLKHRHTPSWATTVVAMSNRDESTLALISGWSGWSVQERWSAVIASVDHALVSETGLASLVERVHLFLQQTIDPVERSKFPFEFNAEMLLTLDPCDPRLDRASADEVAGVLTLAGLGGFDGLAEALGIEVGRTGPAS